MLTLQITDKDLFDEGTEQFLTVKGATVDMEHSLASLSKWEAKYKKPWFGKDGFSMSTSELLDYFQMMCLSPCDPAVFKFMNQDEVNIVGEYMNDSQTATWFGHRDEPSGKGRVITAELVYYWMISLKIPFEAENWNINRLFTLIQVCTEESTPKKNTMTPADRARLNKERLAKFGG